VLIAEAYPPQRREIGSLVEPDKLSPISVMRILNASQPDRANLSDAWMNLLRMNLGDWIERALPASLRTASEWALEQRSALRRSSDLQHEIERFLLSEGPLLARQHLARAQCHSSAAVRRYAASKAFVLQPSLKAFNLMIEQGITPELVAVASEAAMVEALLLDAIGEPASEALVAFISNLPCDTLQDRQELQVDSDRRALGPILQLLGGRVETCRQ
jgi:hypothetical protein